MTASISVTPAPAPAAPTISVSADLAQAYADAITEAKAELAKAEAAFAPIESTISTWVKAHEPFVVGLGLALLILAIRFHVL